MFYQQDPITIANWQSEYIRLQQRYKNLDDKSILEAKGYIDHMEAVSAIMRDILFFSHPFISRSLKQT